MVIRASSNCRDWMRSHGVHFQPSLSGALHVARTNAFFMGGGKALVNAYFRSAERLGVNIRYNAQVTDIELKDGAFVAAHLGEREVDGQRLPAERIQARTCVLAAGGFESNREWLREAWGQNERGEWPSDNFLIRGTRFNTGVLLQRMQQPGCRLYRRPDPRRTWWPSTRARPCMTAASARVSIAYRWAWWSIATANASMTRARISGPSAMRSGAAWWRGSPVNRLTRSSTNKPSVGFMPPVFPGTKANSLQDLARQLKLPVAPFVRTIEAYNAACRVGTFDHTALDDCHTEGLTPAKTHWARPLVKPPFCAYPLKPGVTFTSSRPGHRRYRRRSLQWPSRAPTCSSPEK